MTINAIIGLHDFAKCARVSGVCGCIARRAEAAHRVRSGLPVLWDVVDHKVEPSDGGTFLHFLNSFAECLPPGSTLVMACCPVRAAERVPRRSRHATAPPPPQDNCKFHRYEAGELAAYLLNLYGVRIVYLPPYSPELNPIENAFNVFKFYLRRSEEPTLLQACMDAWSRVTLPKTYGFYTGCGYLPTLK